MAAAGQVIDPSVHSREFGVPVGHGGPSIPQIQLPDRLARLHELSPRAMLIFLSTNLLRPVGPFASCLPAHLMRQCTRGCVALHQGYDTGNDNGDEM